MSEPPRDPSIVPWPRLSEQTLGEHSIFSLARTTRANPDNGYEHVFLRLDAPDWVNIIALTTAGKVILVEQYRHGTDEITLEIPGGAVDEGEAPLAAALRELEEETGFKPREHHLLGMVEPNPAFLSNRCWTYLATGCEALVEPRPDPGEKLAVHTVDLEQFTALIDDGEIRHSLVIAAHDHLHRAVRRGEPWVAGLSESQS